MLTVSHLRKEYTNVLAVDDVSFRVGQGEIFGLLGPNGAGKTTTIRIVLKILEADAGSITYDGKPFSAATRNLMGYLPEERGLYRKSKLLDTIVYFAGLRGVPRGRAKAEAWRWLERLDLKQYAHAKVEELSKGNQQKVQVICAVMPDPQLVILDEPFSGLDPVNQMVLKDLLLELKQRGKGVIFSTHQMEQAEKLSDSLCLIHRGRVVLDGSVRDVKQSYGANSLHLEFEGDGIFLKSLPGVNKAMIYANSAELDLDAGTSIRDILPVINEKLELRKFERREPSLESIFLRLVGGNGAAGQPAEGGKA